MYKSEQLNELFTALAKTQSELPIAGLNQHNPFFKSRYADLTELVKVSRPILSKNGLCVTQIVLKDESSKEILHTILGHNSGQYISSLMTLNPPKTDAQSLASYMSYLKRYAYAAITGVVAADEDDDAELAADRTPSRPIVQTSTYVTPEQHQMLQHILKDSPKLAESIMKAKNITMLAQYPKDTFMKDIEKIRDLVSKGEK